MVHVRACVCVSRAVDSVVAKPSSLFASSQDGVGVYSLDPRYISHRISLSSAP